MDAITVGGLDAGEFCEGLRGGNHKKIGGRGAVPERGLLAGRLEQAGGNSKCFIKIQYDLAVGEFEETVICGRILDLMNVSS